MTDLKGGVWGGVDLPRGESDLPKGGVCLPRGEYDLRGGELVGFGETGGGVFVIRGGVFDCSEGVLTLGLVAGEGDFGMSTFSSFMESLNSPKVYK